MDGGAWWAAVHGVAKIQTWLRDFTLTFHCPALEKEMATRSSVLAWRIPWTEEPGGLLSMGLHRVGHDWSDLAAAAAAVPCSSFFFFTIFHCFVGAQGWLWIFLLFLGALLLFGHLSIGNLSIISTFINWKKPYISRLRMSCMTSV